MPDHLLFIQDLDGKSPDRKIGGGEPVTALPGPHGSGIPGGSRLVEHAHEGLVARQVGTAQFHLTIDRVDLHVYPTHLGIGYLGRQALDDQGGMDCRDRQHDHLCGRLLGRQLGEGHCQANKREYHYHQSLSGGCRMHHGNQL